MKRKAIPIEVKTRLWTAAAGRCQFNGCNVVLWRNELTMDEMNISYIAHIYAYSPEGPRYDALLSPQLEIDFSNLMLVCDGCHRTFDDKSRVNEFSAKRLIAMKSEHEQRIEFLTGIQPNKKSHVILFGTKVGEHSSPLNFKQASQAILPNYYPAMPNAIELGLQNSSFEDSNETFWMVESENLQNVFRQKVEYIKGYHEVQHYSVFGFAPQPLLIKLGTLLNDIYSADIYQLHREPSTWNWLEDEFIEYSVSESLGESKCVALKIELSATITNDRITSVLGNDVDIWSISIPSPSNDYLKSRNQLKKFRVVMRSVFDYIKAKHGQNALLNIFPAMPIAIAIELGRVWMPKADLPMVIYDQNKKSNGFVRTIEIR